VPTLDGKDKTVYVAPGEDGSNSVSHGHNPKYVAPYHTKAPPVVKLVANDDGSEKKVVLNSPGTTVTLQDGEMSPRGTHLKKYNPPDHTSNIPIIKEDPAWAKGKVQW